jgi:hypothetical protein
MKKSMLRYSLATILTIMALIFANPQTVFAQEAIGEIEITALVISVNEVDNSFMIQTEIGDIVTIIPEEGFDFTNLQAGNIVVISGTLNEDGSISAIITEVIEPDGDVINPIDEENLLGQGNFCIQSENQHPRGATLSGQYETEYTTLQSWFCEGSGWGQIKLALQTGQKTGTDAETFLSARNEGAGWGEIWQGLGLIGKSAKNNTLDETDEISLTETMDITNGKPVKFKSDKVTGPPQGKNPKPGRP